MCMAVSRRVAGGFAMGGGAGPFAVGRLAAVFASGHARCVLVVGVFPGVFRFPFPSAPSSASCFSSGSFRDPPAPGAAVVRPGRVSPGRAQGGSEGRGPLRHGRSPSAMPLPVHARRARRGTWAAALYDCSHQDASHTRQGGHVVRASPGIAAMRFMWRPAPAGAPPIRRHRRHGPSRWSPPGRPGTTQRGRTMKRTVIVTGRLSCAPITESQFEQILHLGDANESYVIHQA